MAVVYLLKMTPLSYVTIRPTSLEFKGSTSVPIKGKGKGKQITGTFTASTIGSFLPYATNRCWKNQ